MLIDPPCKGCGGFVPGWLLWARLCRECATPDAMPEPKMKAKAAPACAECSVELPKGRKVCDACQVLRKRRARKEAAAAMRDATLTPRECVICRVVFAPVQRNQTACGQVCRAERKRLQDIESAQRKRAGEARRRPPSEGEAVGISVEQFLEERRPPWARDPKPAPDVWAGYDGSQGAADA